HRGAHLGRGARRHRSGAAPEGPPAVDTSAGDRDPAHRGGLAAPGGTGDRDLLREPSADARGAPAARAHRQAERLLSGGTAQTVTAEMSTEERRPSTTTTPDSVTWWRRLSSSRS